ncbi:hypothetical protein [Compostibacter hankyongensis]|uniref:HTH cro/C1-type domain-containing protein n=1 Tax=Compostibacter hankyongensis TaxID=1007089 RepID=A0ABP8FFA7_9BACT
MSLRPIDRLDEFRKYKELTPGRFERLGGLSNGYFRNNRKGGGKIGDRIADRIVLHFPELSRDWLLTGKGKMIREGNGYSGGTGTSEAENLYLTLQDTLLLELRERIADLKAALEDKEKIIRLLENRPPSGRKGKSR